MERVEQRYVDFIHDKFASVVFCLRQITLDNQLKLLIGVTSHDINTVDQMVRRLEQAFPPLETVAEPIKRVNGWELRPDPDSLVPWAGALYLISAFMAQRCLAGSICKGIPRSTGGTDIGDANMAALLVYASMASANIGRKMSVFRATEQDQLRDYWNYPALYCSDDAMPSNAIFNASTHEARAWTFALWDRDCDDVRASKCLRRRLMLAGTINGMSYFQAIADPLNKQWRFLVVLRFSASLKFVKEAITNALNQHLGRSSRVSPCVFAPVDVCSDHSLIFSSFVTSLYRSGITISTYTYQDFRGTLCRAAEISSQARNLDFLGGQPLQVFSHIRREIERRVRLVMVLMPPFIASAGPPPDVDCFGDLPCVRRSNAGKRAMAAYVPDWDDGAAPHDGGDARHPPPPASSPALSHESGGNSRASLLPEEEPAHDEPRGGEASDGEASDGEGYAGEGYASEAYDREAYDREASDGEAYDREASDGEASDCEVIDCEASGGEDMGAEDMDDEDTQEAQPQEEEEQQAQEEEEAEPQAQEEEVELADAAAGGEAGAAQEEEEVEPADAAAGEGGEAGAAPAKMTVDFWLGLEMRRARESLSYQDETREKLEQILDISARMADVKRDLEKQVEYARNSVQGRPFSELGQKRAREEDDSGGNSPLVEEALHMAKGVRAMLQGFEAQLVLAEEAISKKMRPMYDHLDPQVLAVITGLMSIKYHLTRHKAPHSAGESLPLFFFFSRFHLFSFSPLLV